MPFKLITTLIGRNNFPRPCRPSATSLLIDSLKKRADRMLGRKIFRQTTGSARRRLSALVADDDKFIVLDDANGKSMRFPGIWLRDNCQCSECFHQPTQSRIIDWEAFNPKVRVKSVQIANNLHSKSVRVEWDDEHSCDFSLDWLQDRNFSAEHRRRALDETYRPTPNLWSGREFFSNFKEFYFEDILRSDTALYGWLHALAAQGIAKIGNAPADQGIVRTLTEKIGFIKRTTYGEEFLVKSKPGAKNYAYLMTPLAMHTDMPYYEYMPGVNILHYQTQSSSKGGANLICDGFYVARRLQLEYPKYYNILSTTLVDWNDIGADGEYSFHNSFRAPVICLDLEGNCTRINQNTPRRDSFFRVDVDRIIPWYEAYAKFVELFRDEVVELKIKQGDILTFNNVRLLHGRTAYTDTDENTRCLVGAYVDWDIIYSKLRTLRRALHKKD